MLITVSDVPLNKLLYIYWNNTVSIAQEFIIKTKQSEIYGIVI